MKERSLENTGTDSQILGKKCSLHQNCCHGL